MMDTFQEEDIDENLKDFMTNFKFPWESEDDEVRDNKGSSRGTKIRKVSQRFPGSLYLSETTPARKGGRLSGKNLNKEYSEAGSPVQVHACTQNLKDPENTQSNTLFTELSHVTTHESYPENESQAKNCKQSGQFVGEIFSTRSVEEENNDLPQTSKKRRRRQSSYFKRRESLALLKTIGELSSPCKDKIKDDSSKLQDINENPVSDDGRSERETKKSKTRTSRRRSTRLSGISHPMLELGVNGVPKLIQQPESLLLQNTFSGISDSPEEHHTPMLIETRAEKPFEKSETFTKTSSELLYRDKTELAVTPLHSSELFDTGDVGSQYHTPQNYEVTNIELCSPEQSVLSSLSSLQLQTRYSSDSFKEQEEDNCSGVENLAKSCEEISCKQLSDEDRNVLEPASETSLIPVKDIEELGEEIHQGWKSLPEDGLCEETETKVDISEWKENVDDAISGIAASCHTWTSSSNSFDEMEVDPKVKEIYLKKGQLKPFKRTNTNLETVFEEQKTDVISIGKRKYRRSLAFPEKPWVPRNSRRGSKKQKACKKKRLSLSKTSKKNDTVLGERLNNILDSLVEDC